MSKYRDDLEKYLKNLDVKADRLLDLGGGANPVKQRVNSWDVGYYYIADNSLEEKHIRASLADFSVEFDLNAGLLISGYKGYFDHIFCLEVFEYIYNPVFALQAIAFMLSNGGRATITFPSLYPVHNPQGCDCLRYMYEGIEKLIQESGLKIIRMIPRMPSEEAKQGLMKFWREDSLKVRKSDENVFAVGYIVEVTK